MTKLSKETAMTKFRKGDLCTIQVVIDGNPYEDNDVRVRQPNTYGDLYVKQSDLTMVKPNFAVGDRVTWSVEYHSFTGHVLSLHCDHLWIDRGNAVYATVWTGEAMRIDPEPEVEPQPETPPSRPEITAPKLSEDETVF